MKLQSQTFNRCDGSAPIPKGDTRKQREAKRATKRAEGQRIRKQAEREAGVNMPGRGDIGARLRDQVFRRAHDACERCGARPSDGARLEIDHILPVSLGGETTLDNLQVLCKACHAGKGCKLDPEGERRAAEWRAEEDRKMLDKLARAKKGGRAQ